MRQRLFTLCAAASLLLCVAVCALWVRSHWRWDQAAWRRVNGVGTVQSAHGRVVLDVRRSRWWGNGANWNGLWFTHEPAPTSGTISPAAWMYALNVDAGDTFVAWEHFGFGWYVWQSRDRVNLIAAAAVPHWCLAGVTAVLPAWWAVRRWRARGKPKPTLCRKCGYDLRATPDRCPECGTPARRIPAAT
jgi:hypothetical protein